MDRLKLNRRVAQLESRVRIEMKSVLFLATLFWVIEGPLLWAQGDAEPLDAEPWVLSVAPLGGRLGTSFEIELVGRSLQGADAVWFDCTSLQGKVLTVEEVSVEELEEKGYPENDGIAAHRVVIEVAADEQVEPGVHEFRLICPGGVSKPLTLQIHAEPGIAETLSPHHTPGEPQQITYPAVVSGRISKSGELDYYALRVTEGEALRFEVVTGSGLVALGPHLFNNPHVKLYEPTGSWFDPHRVTRLECEDETEKFYFQYFTGTIMYPTFHRLPRLVHRFDREGWYLAEVSSEISIENGFRHGAGGPDYCYQLRITRADGESGDERGDWTPRVFAHGAPHRWREREFSRELKPDHLERLESRSGDSLASGAGVTNGSGQKSGGPDPKELSSVREQEPNESATQALEIAVPSVIEGTIEQPGDVDYFKFDVTDDQSLAFEIETPDAGPPHFNPHLEILGEDEGEVLSNIFRKVGGDGDDWLKSIEAKTLYRFDQGGSYYLRIRDLTLRHGTSRFNYRILVRPQVPHVGDVEIEEQSNTILREGIADVSVNRINLVRGKARKFTVTAGREEGYEGDIAILLENLPPGTRAIPAVDVDKEKGPAFARLDEDRYAPAEQKVNIMLLASEDAPLTDHPQWIRLTAQPVARRTLGKPIVIEELPLMVVR